MNIESQQNAGVFKSVEGSALEERRAAPTPAEIKAAREAGLIKRLGSALEAPTLQPARAEQPKVILSGGLQEQVAKMQYDLQPEGQKVQRMSAISDADIAAYNARRNPNQTH